MKSCICSWIRRQVLLDKIRRIGEEVLLDFVVVPGGLVLPPNSSLEDYFMEVKLEMIKYLFPLESRVDMREKGVSNKSQRAKELIHKAGLRLVFR